MNSYLNQFLIRFDFKNYELGKHRNPFLFEFSIFLEIFIFSSKFVSNYSINS